MSPSLFKFVVGGLFQDKTWESQMYKTILLADKFTNDHTQVDIIFSNVKICQESCYMYVSLHDVWAHWSYIWVQKILRLSAKKSTIERILP